MLKLAHFFAVIVNHPSRLLAVVQRAHRQEMIGCAGVSYHFVDEPRRSPTRVVECVTALKPDDYLVTTYRGVHDQLAKGVPLKSLWAEFTGKATGTCKGKGTVSLVPIQRHASNGPAYLEMNYSFTGGGVTSQGLLHRTDASHLAPVFKEAGLTSP